jgi:hypothetical protein
MPSDMQRNFKMYTGGLNMLLVARALRLWMRGIESDCMPFTSELASIFVQDDVLVMKMPCRFAGKL